MSRKERYAVRISGLADGDHDFSMVLDREFFSLIEQTEVEEGRVDAGIVLEKKPGVLSLHFHLHGEVEVVCDRCLEPFMMEIETRQTLYVKTGETSGEIEDDVIMIQKEDHEIEVGQFLYEFTVLALPYRRIHPPTAAGGPGCDPEMIRHLEAHRSGSEKKENRDPRWDALKGMIEKEN